MSVSALATVDDWLQRHHGVISRQVLLQMGHTAGQIDWLIKAERWTIIRRGIYCSPSYPIGREQLMVAACLLNPEVAVGFTTAGQEWGLRGMTDDTVHVLAPHHLKVRIPGVVVHRCRVIEPIDVAHQRPDGIRLTSPPRTLLDAASIIGHRNTESALEQILQERRCTVATLMSVNRRLRHARRPGAAIFEAVLLGRPAWRRAARSELERLMREAIERRGLPSPEVNMPMVLANDELIVIDLAWPQWKVALEVDHPFWHDGAVEAQRDKRRDRKLAALGWLPQRVTAADIDHYLAETLDDVANVLRARGWSGH